MLDNINLFIMDATMVMGSSGLSNIWENILRDWIRPVFLCAVAVGAFMFIKSQKITQLILFLVVAAIVGLLIFAGNDLFGPGGTFKNMFKNTADHVASQNSGGIGN